MTFTLFCVILYVIKLCLKEDNMTKNEEIYYNNYFDLFRSEGWAQIVDELKDRLERIDINQLENEKDLFRMKGELSVINMLLGFETLIESYHEEAENSSNSDTL